MKKLLSLKYLFVLFSMMFLSTYIFADRIDAENYLTQYFHSETGVYQNIVLPGALYEYIAETDITLPEDKVLTNPFVTLMQSNLTNHVSYEILSYKRVNKKDYLTVRFTVFRFKKEIAKIKQISRERGLGKEAFTQLYLFDLANKMAQIENYEVKNMDLVFERTSRGYDMVYANYNSFLKFLKSGE